MSNILFYLLINGRTTKVVRLVQRTFDGLSIYRQFSKGMLAKDC